MYNPVPLRSLAESSYEFDVRPADNAVTILSVFISVCGSVVVENYCGVSYCGKFLLYDWLIIIIIAFNIKS